MIKAILRPVRDTLFEQLPLPLAIRLEFLAYHHRWPRLNPPVTFSEKIVKRKMVDRDARMPRLSDKILVKDYVAGILGEDWIIPNLWTGTRLPPRAERDWPIPFVVKASHGSGWNDFVRSEKELDWDRTERLAEYWMRSTHACRAKEWLYTQIQPRLL